MKEETFVGTITSQGDSVFGVDFCNQDFSTFAPLKGRKQCEGLSRCGDDRLKGNTNTTKSAPRGCNFGSVFDARVREAFQRIMSSSIFF